MFGRDLQFITLVVAISLGAACARPMSTPSSYEQVDQERKNSESLIRAKRAERDALSLKKQSAKYQFEIDDLQKQIDVLEKEIARLEKRINDLEHKGATTSSSGKNIGPRGGCYTITKSGKKNYGGC